MTRRNGRQSGTPDFALRGLLGVVLALAFVLSGCTDSGSGSLFSSGDSAEVNTLATTSKIGLVQGKLKGGARGVLERKIVASVDSWIDGGFGGSYPRDDFSEAFANFTSGAAKDARRDLTLMTNAGLDAQEIELTKRWVRVDVVALDKRPVGITARIAIEQKADAAAREERLTGSLFLAFRKGGWKVFGYDIERGIK